MDVRFSMVGLAVALSACGPGPDAVWLFTSGESQLTAADFSCQENFNTADCPLDGEDPGSDWTYTDDFDRSPGAFFGQILDGPGGEKVLVVGGEVYVGEKSGGAWRFEWESYENGSETEVHTSGYRYEISEDITVTTALVVELSGARATGRTVVREEVTARAQESDTWLSEEVGFSFGQIFDDAPTFLEGDNVNFADQAECIAGDCIIEVTSVSEIETPFDAIRTDADDDGYEGVRNAGQSPGTD